MAFTIDYRIDHTAAGFELFMLHSEGYDVDFGDAFATREKAEAAAKGDAEERGAVANIKIKTTTTFEQFVASRKITTTLYDLSEIEDDVDGYIYLDSFYINIDNLGEESEKKRVVIGNCEYAFDDLEAAEKFLWDEFAMLECNNYFKAVRFCFGDDTTYDGFTDGSTWNGFDNIWVTEKVHKQISDYFLNVCKYDPEECSLPDEMDEQRLYDYSGGFATSIDE